MLIGIIFHSLPLLGQALGVNPGGVGGGLGGRGGGGLEFYEYPAFDT